MARWPTLVAVLVLVLVVFVTDLKCSTIDLHATPTAIKPLVTSHLGITCVLRDTAPVGPVVGRRKRRGLDIPVKHDDLADQSTPHTPADRSNRPTPAMSKKTVTHTDDNMQFITSMLISRDGVDLVVLTEHFPLKQFGTGFTATGQLTGGVTGETGHLQLTYPHPTRGEVGNYSCVVSGLNSQGHTFVFSKSVVIREEEPSLTDIIGKLHTIELEKEEIQATIGGLNTTIRDLKVADGIATKTIKELNTTIDALNTTIDGLKTTIGVLKAENSALNRSLAALKSVARVEPSVFFSALLSSTASSHTWSYSTNDIVIYNKIIVNEGSGYDGSTGIFTAPMAGFYKFDIHAYTRGSSYYAHLGLNRNGNTIVTVSNYGDDERGASNSAVLRLAKGDVVKVASTNSGSHLSYDNTWRMANTFTGQLIALV